MKIENIQLNALCEIGGLSNEGLIIYSLIDNEVFFINTIASVLFNYVQKTPFIIESFLQIVIPKDIPYLEMRLANISDQLVCLDVEFCLQKENNTFKYVCCNAYLILEKTFLVLSIRDVTKPKEQGNYIAEFGVKNKTLLDTAIHDLSGVLNLTKNLVYEAKKSVDVLNKLNLKTYLNLISENNIHCLKIVDDLENTDNDKSALILVKRSFDIVEKIEALYQNLLDKYKIKKITLETNASCIYGHADDVKMLLIVNNLISNAIKFTTDTGIIKIKIDEKDTNILISVSDNGIGIAEELQPFVFDRKGKARRMGLNGEISMGLGLSICKNFVEMMDGEIWVESTVGSGSTFYFTLSK